MMQIDVFNDVKNKNSINDVIILINANNNNNFFYWPNDIRYVKK